MKNLGLENVQEAQDMKKLSPNGYICKILSVEDVADKEYLKFTFDIAEGEFKDVYQNIFEAKNYWLGKFVKSYKSTALPFFKQFITAVERSNNGYRFDCNNENGLVGKLVGIVLAEEEYEGNDGTVKVRLYAHSFRSLEAIRKGDFQVPALKKLANKKSSAFDSLTPLPDGVDDDMPF